MVTDVVVATEFVLRLNVADLDPPGTVTVVWTVAKPLFDTRVTTSPPGPARPFRVTVPVDDVPPTTEFDERETLNTPAGTTPMYWVWMLLPIDAAMATVV